MNFLDLFQRPYTEDEVYVGLWFMVYYLFGMFCLVATHHKKITNFEKGFLIVMFFISFMVGVGIQRYSVYKHNQSLNESVIEYVVDYTDYNNWLEQRKLKEMK